MLIIAHILLASMLSELRGPEAGYFYGCMNAMAASLRHQQEQAAFLRHRPDGHLTLTRWPPGDQTSATYRGSVPPDCIAIVHTHPENAPRPSVRDIANAIRLHIPVVVITPDGVMMAAPDGVVVELFGRGWTSHV
jgi:hypothetical protein